MIERLLRHAQVQCGVTDGMMGMVGRSEARGFDGSVRPLTQVCRASDFSDPRFEAARRIVSLFRMWVCGPLLVVPIASLRHRVVVGAQ